MEQELEQETLSNVESISLPPYTDEQKLSFALKWKGDRRGRPPLGCTEEQKYALQQQKIAGQDWWNNHITQTERNEVLALTKVNKTPKTFKMASSAPTKSPEREELEKFFEPLTSQTGFSLPREGTMAESTFVFSRENEGKQVSKRQYTEWMNARSHTSTDYQAIRHLPRTYGLNIFQKDGNTGTPPGGWQSGMDYYIGDLTQKSHRMKLAGNFYGLDWNACCEAVGHRCEVCFWEEGTRHPLGHIIELEKGHRNPSAPDTSENLMIVCQRCNQIQSNKFSCDSAGCPKALTNLDLLRAASEELQKMAWEELNVKFTP